MNFFLIADDSQAKQVFLVSLVKKSGIAEKILTAKTTSEAKRLIDTQADIAFAFIDYEMPEEEGQAVIAYLRTKNPDARIALVTSADSQRYKDDAMAAGADAFVCTSYDEKSVTKRILELLEEWKVV